MGFKGCSPAPSYPQRVSYLISPPGLSVAVYSRVCRTYLCNNLTNLDPFVKLKENTPKPTAFSSHSCPTCVGEHSKDCLPNFVTTDSCPSDASKCYSSTLTFQAGERREMPTLCQVLSSTFPSLREAGGIQREDLGCGHQAYELQGRRAWCPILWWDRGVLVCEGCLGGGTGYLSLECPDFSLSPYRASQHHLPPHGLCS